MSNQRVVVSFLKSWRGYAKGEKAGFEEAQANSLVDGGVAEMTDGSKAAGGGGGKKGKAKAGANSVETPPAPPAADDAPAPGDDEPKP